MVQNLEYIKWNSIDLLLIGCLYSSMTPEIAMRVMGCSSNALQPAVEESYGIYTEQVKGYFSWFVDSGASSHVTSNKGKLSTVRKYEGNEKLLVGDGNSLHISHIGRGNIHSQNNRSLALNNLLHVLAIKKNLISVSQLTNDNNVFKEFYSDCCVVKDLKTRMILLQRVLKDGLYQLKLPSPNPKLTTKESHHQNNSNYFSMMSSCDASTK